MSNLFSIPMYPNAVSYNIQYSDPLVGNPNQPNPLGPWTTLTGSPFSYYSNIYDAAGTPLRMYRAAPTISVPNVGNVTLQYYDAFSVYQPAPQYYVQTLYDPQITAMLPSFRAYIGDYGEAGTSSTNVNIDTGAGIGVLTPDGVTTQYNVADIPDTTPPIILDYSVQIVKNNLTLLFNTDYYVNGELGQVIFATAPLATDAININYIEVRYSNRQLCAALATAVDMVATFNISGYGISYDNNVRVVQGTISGASTAYNNYVDSNGLPYSSNGAAGLNSLIMVIALKVLNRAMTRLKADQARAYKTQDFSIDTAPGRVIDGLSTLSNFDFQEIRAMANAYIKSATIPTVRDTYAAFFDSSGTLPVYNLLVGGFYGMGYQAWM